MIRLIDAEILKLRRRTGMLVMVALLSVGAVAIYYGVTFAMHPGAAGGVAHFNDMIAVLALSGSVVGVIVGATAGAAVAILLAWAVVALAAGAWRSNTQEI